MRSRRIYAALLVSLLPASPTLAQAKYRNPDSLAVQAAVREALHHAKVLEIVGLPGDSQSVVKSPTPISAPASAPAPTPAPLAPASIPQITKVPVDYYNQGVESANGGHWAEAMETFKQAIRLNPDDADAHFQLGYANQQLKQYAEAIPEYKEAIRLNPDNADVYFYLGWCENGLGKYSDAVEPLQEAARRDSQSALARAASPAK
jgi:tetratricopeptide (TPR) repeat protein